MAVADMTALLWVDQHRFKNATFRAGRNRLSQPDFGRRCRRKPPVPRGGATLDSYGWTVNKL